jgi:hypothetical protein
MKLNHFSKLEKLSHLPTREAARVFGVQPQTLRRGFCVDGSYMGIVPAKLPNLRLLWPTEKIREILEGRIDPEIV